jgi:hypothetical protein
MRLIAEAVEERLGRSKVFLDEWYEDWIAGSDADSLLQDLYNKRCALAVMCISERSGGKPWTLGEYDAIRAQVNKARTLASEKDRLGVLPIRVGDGDVQGIFLETWIVPDVRPTERSLDKSVELIVNRLHRVAPESHQTAAPTAQPPIGSDGGASRRVEQKSPAYGALAVWQERLEFLQVEEAKAADPGVKFSLRKSIEEAKAKIREHGGHA